MSISKYSRPAQATIQKTQVLPDIGFMSHQLDKRQQRYDVNSQQLQATEGELSKLQGVGKVASNYIKAVDDQFKVLSNELLKTDLGDPKNAKGVRDKIYAIKNDPELIKHITAKKAFDNYQKTIAELSKEGEIPAGNLWGYKKMWDHYSTTGEFNSELANPTIIKGVDRLKEAKELFSHIKASGGDTLGFLQSNAGKVAYENGWKGIDINKINQTVLENLNMMMGSKLGRELTKEFEMMKEVSGGKGLPARTSTEYVYNTLMGVGNSFIHGESSTNIDTAFNKAGDIDRAVAKEKKEKETLSGSTYSESFKSNKYGGEAPEFKDGKLVGSGKSYGELWKESKDPLDFIGKVFNNDTLEGPERKKAENQRIIVGAALNGVSHEDYVNATAKDRSVDYRPFIKNSDSENLSKMLFDEGSGLLQNLQIITKDGGKQPAFDALGKELGVEPTAINIAKALKDTDNPVKIKAMGYVNPSEQTKYGVMLSVNGNNMIVDMAPMVKTLPQEQRLQIELEYAAARADAGIPTKVMVPGEDGKLKQQVWYKDVNLGQVKSLEYKEYQEKLKAGLNNQ